MFSTICSGALQGISAYPVSVEVNIARGLPAFYMVGSLSGEVRESRERVCVALKNAGFDLPPSHVTVNLSPADRRKEGTAFDLPIAVGILAAAEYFPQAAAADILFLGELGLDGEIKQVPGVLPIVQEAAKGASDSAWCLRTMQRRARRLRASRCGEPLTYGRCWTSSERLWRAVRKCSPPVRRSAV